jgi:ribose/xylose/arabinose/galactoside ABC-type transport system permease subunit
MQTSPADADAVSSGWRLPGRRVGGTLVVLGAVWLAFGLLDPIFFTYQNLKNILLQSSSLAIIAAGLTLVMITAEFDLSLGSIEGFSGCVVAVLAITEGLPIGVAMVAGLAAGLTVGVINGLITWKLLVPSFITTLAMLGVVQGTAFLVTDARAISGFPDSFRVLGTGEVWGVPVPAILAAVVFTVLHVVLNRTAFGLRIYAVGSDAGAARLAGIEPGRIRLAAFAISGCLAAIGGFIISARLNSGNGDFGSNDILLAVAAVVIGGTSLTGGVGTMLGTAMGVLIITSVETGLVIVNVQPFWHLIAIGGLIIAAVVLDRIVKSRQIFSQSGTLVP